MHLGSIYHISCTIFCIVIAAAGVAVQVQALSFLSPTKVASSSLPSSSSSRLARRPSPSHLLSTADNMSGDLDSSSLQFGRFSISPSQIFYRSPSNLSAAIVNLRPIVPGHVLVISTRVVPHLSDLSEKEYVDLWMTMRKVQDMLGRRYFASDDGDGDDGTKESSPEKSSAAAEPAFNVAVQDGGSAGQSVPHVHVHILPRISGDFVRNDDVYDTLEAWAPREEECEAKKEQAGNRLEVLDDADRKDRTMEQMAKEAEEYRKLMR